jgi:hypothetical protein
MGGVIHHVDLVLQGTLDMLTSCLILNAAQLEVKPAVLSQVLLCCFFYASQSLRDQCYMNPQAVSKVTLRFLVISVFSIFKRVRKIAKNDF